MRPRLEPKSVAGQLLMWIELRAGPHSRLRAGKKKAVLEPATDFDQSSQRLLIAPRIAATRFLNNCALALAPLPRAPERTRLGQSLLAASRVGEPWPWAPCSVLPRPQPLAYSEH